jgi:hypothetical protein
MKEKGMKRQETASLRVSKDTRERVMSYLTSLIGERGQLLTQDDAVKEMLDCVERKRNKSSK